MTTGGAVPGGVASGGVLPEGVFSGGVLSEGVFSEGVAPGGVLPGGVFSGGVGGVVSEGGVTVSDSGNWVVAGKDAGYDWLSDSGSDVGRAGYVEISFVGVTTGLLGVTGGPQSKLILWIAKRQLFSLLYSGRLNFTDTAPPH